MTLRHFLRDDDVSSSEQSHILDLASRIKTDRFSARPLAGPRSVAVLFDKPSTRTRASFTAGVAELGGQPIVIDTATSQLARGETPADTAHVLSGVCAAIVWRTYGQEILEQAAAASSVPVINALSDTFHPCQILADLLTLREYFADLQGQTPSNDALVDRTLAFVGDAHSNMAHSYALGMALAGMHVRLVGPQKYQPDPAVMDQAHAIAADTGGSVMFTTELDAVSDVDVIATDTWASMGLESYQDERLADLAPYQLNAALLARSPHAAVLHCLPAHRGQEVSADVLDGPRSLIWQQAENRLHAQKALMVWLLDPDSRLP